jgi:N-carbamoylputrescine amidase
MQVAAFQNGYFVALCNRVGEEECLTLSGESFVCAPDGRVLARAASLEDAILYVDVDLAETGTHARRLFLRDRRPDLYAGWFAGGSGPLICRRQSRAADRHVASCVV